MSKLLLKMPNMWSVLEFLRNAMHRRTSNAEKVPSGASSTRMFASIFYKRPILYKKTTKEIFKIAY